MLFQTLAENKLSLANRIVMPPMATHLSPEGCVTEELCTHYAARASAGTGLIITEHCCIAQSGRADPRQLSVAEDSLLPGLTRLSSCVHASGPSKIFVQINHAGSQTQSSVTGCELMSASALPHPALTNAEKPRPLTQKEIADLVSQFALAAKRVRAAGFDGVEIHAAHGYLLNQFYSPLTNQRTDSYGSASLENRLRFLLETLDAVQAAVGADFPVAVRLGGSDYMPGGSTIADSVAAAQMLEEAGADILDISGGMCRYTRPEHKEAGWFSDMSQAIKKVVSIPVILTGGIKTRAQAEELLSKGAADMIGIGRAMLKDAAWSQKARTEV
ncbi:MAG: NADH:flavin oxidoreductase [Desulfovibrionaceae bacterium]|nr:NADH:flavin oxidoreductase [Desulfovibrionaceae bacterium]